METNAFFIIFLILLFDSLFATALAWFGGRKWYSRHFRIISRFFPMTKGWATYYLILVIFIGCLLRYYGGWGF